MSKGAVGIIAGFWPEDVYRYLQTPSLSVDEAVVVRPARRHAERPALIADASSLTYQELGEDVGRAAAWLRATLDADHRRVAFAVERQLDLVRVFIGALRAGCAVLLLDPGASARELRMQLESFKPDLVVADGATLASGWGADLARQTTAPADLLSGPKEAPAAPSRTDLEAPTAALVGADGRRVYHSHTTLLTWAVSWSAFLRLDEDASIVSLEPLHRWGGLAAVLAVLWSGGTCVLAPPREVQAPNALSWSALGPSRTSREGSYAIASFASLTALAGARGPLPVGAAGAPLAGILATIEGPFATRERLRLEVALGTPILTVLGSAAAGPVIASHPSWYLREAAGIPLTNVDLWPLNPTTRDPLMVPWESIEFGEVGVQSPLTAVEFQTPQDRETHVGGGWLRLGVIATMDPNGLFHLRS